MNDALKKSIADHLGTRVNAVGFAPLDRFVDAPEKHHPANACKDAGTVLCFDLVRWLRTRSCRETP